MPELKKTIVTGAGLAGIIVSIRAAQMDPDAELVLLEKAPIIMPWIDRKGLDEYPLAWMGSVINPYSDNVEIWQGQEWLLGKWDITSLEELLGPSFSGLTVERDKQIICRDLKSLRKVLGRRMASAGVECICNYSLESVSVQPDGTFRIWSREGQSIQGRRLVMATGGERNHGLKIARELGAEVSTPIPAFVRLRLASPKLGDRMGPLECDVKVRCLKSGSIAHGKMTISSRGLEGEAISCLSAMQCELWSKLDYSLQIEVDWLPGDSGASILKQLCSRKETGGKRNIADTPMFGFPDRSWGALLKSSRIPVDTSWAKIKMKKVQALANRIKADRISINGMGLPENERAWSGGVNLDSLDQQKLESRSVPGVYFAGEILNLRGMPGGNHQDLICATARVAGDSTVTGA